MRNKKLLGSIIHMWWRLVGYSLAATRGGHTACTPPWASSTATRYRQSITSCARDSTGRRHCAAQLYGDVLWRLVCFISCLCDWCINNNHVEVPPAYRCARAPQPRGIARERWVHAQFFQTTNLNLPHFLLSRFNRGLKLHNVPINLELMFN